MTVWHSQAGQDEWIATRHAGGPGYFVDVGAWDGVATSNTYTLEAEFGWRGVCIEPHRGAFEALRGNRRCVTTGVAASDRAGVLGFTGDHVDPAGQETVICLPLVDILRLANAPTTIDYLSIDVEGHELAVLAGMDFGMFHVKHLTIEHNLYRDGPDLKDAIHAVLTGHGFRRVVEDAGCVDPCPPPAWTGCPFEDWYVR